MIEKKVRRFELNSDEALAMVANYLHDHHGVDEPVAMIKHVMDTTFGMLVEVYMEAGEEDE